MMIRNNFIIVVLALIIILVDGCVEPYSPPESKNVPDIMVVDGFLNASDGSVNLSLTKAVGLTEAGDPPVIDNATVYLEDSENTTLPLDNILNGKYKRTGIAVDYDREYRIRIVTAANKEYVSDFLTIKPTPEIDSVNWVPVGDGIEIRVNTHDVTENSRYYLWSFEEAWHYRAPYTSMLIVENGEVRVRTDEEQYDDCWRTEESSKVLIGSSIRLDTDIISQAPLQFIEKGSQRLSVKYSILVKQTVLSASMHDFYEKLRKTTEELGSLFDPQPGRVVGNVHSTSDPGETVLGVFNAGEVKEKRIFISYHDLPDDYKIIKRSGCLLDTLKPENLPFFSQQSNNVVGIIYEGITIVGYTYSSISCTDCRTQGGTTSKPSYWPN